MKIFIYTLLFLSVFSESAWSSLLSPDFFCEGQTQTGIPFSLEIRDIKNSGEMKLKGSANCVYQIENAYYSKGGKAEQMIIYFKQIKGCKNNKNFNFMSEGYIKFNPNEESAYALILKEHQPISCKVIHFRKNKMLEWAE